MKHNFGALTTNNCIYSTHIFDAATYTILYVVYVDNYRSYNEPYNSSFLVTDSG